MTAGVLEHGAVDMLGVLARLVLVEDVEHLAQEFAAAVLRDLLRDRNQLHARLAQFPDVEFRVHRVATEAAERVDDNQVERVAQDAEYVDLRKTQTAPSKLRLGLSLAEERQCT